jgi:lipoprotein-releasing system ATP-binding protein
MSQIVLCCQAVNKSYRSGPETIDVLRDVSLEVQCGDSIAIRGVSGSGKSTLLNILGGLDNPSSGEVQINGEPWSDHNESGRARLRNQHLGFVYQFHHLLPEFSAAENVAMPLLLRGIVRKSAEQEARQLLDAVGLHARYTHRPSELSGGERQRVAIARALVTKPLCVLMDEPTGNLDKENAERILDLIVNINRDIQVAMILVTHDDQVASRLEKGLTLVNGHLES